MMTVLRRLTESTSCSNVGACKMGHRSWKRPKYALIHADDHFFTSGDGCRASLDDDSAERGLETASRTSCSPSMGREDASCCCVP